MRNRDTIFWLLLTPVIFALLVVVIIPFLLGLYYSFTDWNGFGDVQFLGFEHYIELFKDKEFMHSLTFTIKFSIASIVLINLFGLGLALIVTTNIKSSNLLRTIFFMPNLIGGLILGFIWQFVFIRVFASIGEAIGMEALQGWLTTTKTGFWGLVILMTWQLAGYVMVIYIAYLQNIPQELIEAADIDGANAFQRLKNIKLPLIAPAFTISLFFTLSNSFKLYDQNLALTNGAPFNSTQMVAMDIVNTAFAHNQMAYAQSKAVIFFILVAIIGLSQVSLSQRREVEM